MLTVLSSTATASLNPRRSWQERELIRSTSINSLGIFRKASLLGKLKATSFILSIKLQRQHPSPEDQPVQSQNHRQTLQLPRFNILPLSWKHLRIHPRKANFSILCLNLVALTKPP